MQLIQDIVEKENINEEKMFLLQNWNKPFTQNTYYHIFYRDIDHRKAM